MGSPTPCLSFPICKTEPGGDFFWRVCLGLRGQPSRAKILTTKVVGWWL